MWKNNMANIARVGSLTAPQFRNMPTLDLAGAIDNYTTARNKSLEAARRQAYVDELTAKHPEAAAQIAADPAAYDKMLQDNAAAERDQQYKMDYLAQQLGNSLALENARNANAVGLAKLAAQLKGNGTTGMQNIEYLQSLGYSPEEAAQLYYAGNNPTLDMAMLGKKGTEAMDKKLGENVANEVIAQKQMRTLRPKVENALLRAEESLKQGSGLGQIGGWGWTSGQGGQNRANIKNAQTQINTTMRGLLKQMGVGSTELNSAVEAEAYRYMLSPDMPIGQQLQVINNFKQDYLSGELARDLAQTYGNGAMTEQYNEGDIAEDANGNRLVFRGGKWQKM